MKKFLIFATLLSSAALADRPITGHIEGRRYFWTNQSAYPDLTGEPMKYGVDFEMMFPTAFDPLAIMAGADASTNSHQFAQIAGRFGADVKIYDWNVGVYHRSNHSIDHTPTKAFPNANYIYVRYNFTGAK